MADVDNKIFSKSAIERDLAITGGERVVARVFCDTLDFTGSIQADKKGEYHLVADIIPDQSRVFKKARVRVDGIYLTEDKYKIHDREDGLKVISVDFPVERESFQTQIKKIEVVWAYDDEDIKYPDIFKSELTITGLTGYTKEFVRNGYVIYKGAYNVIKGDYTRVLGTIKINLKKPDADVVGLVVRKYMDYKRLPEICETEGDLNNLDNVPDSVSIPITINPDTLMVGDIKVDLIWATTDGNKVETFCIDTDTISYALDFLPPVPCQVSKDKYPELNLDNIYRNINRSEKEFNEVYQGYHELKGRDVYLRVKLPAIFTSNHYRYENITAKLGDTLVTPEVSESADFKMFDFTVQPTEENSVLVIDVDNAVTKVDLTTLI